MIGDKLYAGTQSRGCALIENGEAKEIVSRPRSFFINALETDAKGRLWVGARGGKEESALFDQSDPLKPIRANAPTGPVTAITRGSAKTSGLATDGRGAFHLRDGKLIERFTFNGTGGALRSDHVYGVFVDAEEVVWFATDKGVCRYDPNAARTETIANDANANYVRALWRTSKGSLLAGTNAGLFVHDAARKRWRRLPSWPPNCLCDQRRQLGPRFGWHVQRSACFLESQRTRRLRACRRRVTTCLKATACARSRMLAARLTSPRTVTALRSCKVRSERSCGRNLLPTIVCAR